MVQALIKGEIDFAEDITPLQVEALQDEDGDHRPQRRSRRSSRRSASTPARRHRDRRADRRRQPGGAGPEVPARPRLRRRQRADRADAPTRAPRARARRSSRRRTPPGTGTRRTTRRSPSTSTRPPRSSTRPATRWARTASGPCRTALPIGTLRLFARSEQKTSVDTMDLFQGWLGQLGIDAEVTAMDSSTLGDKILDGDLRRLPVGLVRRARPRRDPGRLHLRPARRPVRLVVLRRGATTRCTPRRASEMDKDKRVEIVQQMQQQLYEDVAVHRHRRHRRSARRSAPTSSPASSRSPTPAGSGCSSTAAATTRCCGRRTRPATATASRPRSARSRRTAAHGPAPPPRPRPAAGTRWAASSPGCSSTLVVVAGVWVLQRRRTVDDRE